MGKSSYEPFSIMEALSEIGISYNPNGVTKNQRVKCPKCGHIDFYVDVTRNIGHCYRSTCGYKCNQISLVADHYGVSGKEAIAMMLGKKASGKVQSYTPPTVHESEPIADIEKLNTVYKSFYTAYSLSDRHKKDLQNRGLTQEEIKRLPYFSYEKDESFARRLYKELKSVSGIPGLYMSPDGADMQNIKGIFVPYFDSKRRIQGFQCRYNEEDRKVISGKKQAKYGWFSTNGYDHGTKATAVIHYAFDWSIDLYGNYSPIYSKEVYLTEGAMKADIIHLISGINLIAVPGVNCLGQLPSVLSDLKAHGVQTIINAYDMDYINNPDVADACNKAANLIKGHGFKYKRAAWDIEKGKGLDDFMAAKRKEQK